MKLEQPSPLAPPRIPISRRLGKFVLGFSPFVIWLLVLGVTAWLYVGEPEPSHVLAYASFESAKVVVPFDGKIARVTVKPGQRIEAGDLVATLDTADLDARLRIARSKLKVTQQRIEALREKLRLEYADRLSQAEARSLAYEADGRRRRDLIEQIATANRTDEAELLSLLPEIERLKTLRNRKLTTADRFEELLRNRKVLKETIAARKEQAGAAKDELAAWRSLKPGEPAQPNHEMQLLPVQLQVEAQEARISELELQRAKFRLLAPVSGHISQCDVHAGEWRIAGNTIVQILVPKPDYMTAFLRERRVGNVEIGDEVTLRPRQGRISSQRGRVVMVGPKVELIPEQLRVVHSVPEWGRPITIKLDDKADSVPGQVFSVRFP